MAFWVAIQPTQKSQKSLNYSDRKIQKYQNALKNTILEEVAKNSKFFCR
jgi:hypothetical protein